MVVFSCQAMTDSLQLHELQHARFLCLSPSPGICPSFHIYWIGDATQHLILCLPILLLPPIFPSIRVFSNESPLCIRWPKCWSFSISPFQEYSGLISLKTEWFELLAVQGTLKRLLQQHSSKASILPYSAFFMVQISHLYMTTGKTVALIIWTLVGKVMPLLFNTLSRFVIAFLSRSNQLLVPQLQSHLQWF